MKVLCPASSSNSLLPNIRFPGFWARLSVLVVFLEFLDVVMVFPFRLSGFWRVLISVKIVCFVKK